MPTINDSTIESRQSIPRVASALAAYPGILTVVTTLFQEAYVALLIAS